MKHVHAYGADRDSVRRWSRLSAGPLDAITFDRVELSGEQPELVSENTGLIKIITEMNSSTVDRKIKNYLDSFTTIDDAIAEKIFMEAI